MNYLGGKARLGAEIARVVLRHGAPKGVLEPFCGACWVTQHFHPERTTAADLSAPLITLHRAVQSGWIPPDEISEAEYEVLHDEWIDGEITPLIGFVGYGCSWGGKWWGGYARGDGRNYCQESKQSLLRKHGRMANVEFLRANYKNLDPKGMTIYCDPPYKGTTGYGGEWDSVAFWAKVREWSDKNTVYVSEYQAPEDFEVIWSEKHFSFAGTDSRETTESIFKRRM